MDLVFAVRTDFGFVSSVVGDSLAEGFFKGAGPVVDFFMDLGNEKPPRLEIPHMAVSSLRYKPFRV